MSDRPPAARARGTVSIAMPANIYFGFGVASHNTNQITTAAFRDFGVVTGATSNATSALPTAIRRYDPTSNKWSDITKPPQSGDLLAVTSSGTSNGAVLWLKSFVGGKTALYRYVVR